MRRSTAPHDLPGRHPDVPSVRNAQRVLERIGQLGACGDRFKILLNRAAEPIRSAGADRDRARRTIDHISRAIQDGVDSPNTGVPLALAGNGIAAQFHRFTRLRSIRAETSERSRAAARWAARLASLW